MPKNKTGFLDFDDCFRGYAVVFVDVSITLIGVTEAEANTMIATTSTTYAGVEAGTISISDVDIHNTNIILHY